MSLPDYLNVNPYLSAALADFPMLVEIEKLPKQSINQEVCQSKAGGINQSCELTAEVWHHNKSYSSPNSMSYSQEEQEWHLSVKDTVGKCKWSAVRKMSLSHQAPCVWLLLMCFHGGGKVGDVWLGWGDWGSASGRRGWCDGVDGILQGKKSNYDWLLIGPFRPLKGIASTVPHSPPGKWGYRSHGNWFAGVDEG